MPANKYIEIKKSLLHYFGAFAKTDIAKEVKIIEYIGEKISKEESEKRGQIVEAQFKNSGDDHGATYIFELNDEYDLDGNVPENTARFINHSCDPNCDISITDDRIWIIADKDIKTGEELTYNYGWDFDPKDYCNHPCHCGSKNCIGFIVKEKDWPKIPKNNH